MDKTQENPEHRNPQFQKETPNFEKETLFEINEDLCKRVAVSSSVMKPFFPSLALLLSSIIIVSNPKLLTTLRNRIDCFNLKP